MLTTKEINDIERLLLSSVPRNTAYLAAGLRVKDVVETLKKNPDISHKFDVAEAQAFSRLIESYHALASTGDAVTTGKLLTLRHQLGNEKGGELVDKVLDIAQRVLPTEWNEKLLGALEESGL